jgi:hypothetical protein
MKTKLGMLISAGVLAVSIGARAHQAPEIDSNVAAAILATMQEGNSPQLAAAPDPNVGPSTSDEDARVSDANDRAPEIAIAPNPNVAVSD